MYIQRKLAQKLSEIATKFPVVALVGPRQSGKTTLARETFPSHAYFSLETPNTIDRIKADPQKFIAENYGTGVIIDEFQREPQLLSYIQGIVDNN